MFYGPSTKWENTTTMLKCKIVYHWTKGLWCLFVFFTVCPQKKEKFTRNVKISFWASGEINGRAVTQASHQSCCYKHKMSAVNILSYKKCQSRIANWPKLIDSSHHVYSTNWVQYQPVSTRILNYLGLFSLWEPQNVLHMLPITLFKQSAFEWICEWSVYELFNQTAVQRRC